MKTELSEKLILIFKIIIFVSLSALIVGLISFNAADKSAPIAYEAPEFIDEWTVTDSNGHTFTTGRTYRNSDGTLGNFRAVSRLPENIGDDSYFCFITGGNVDVFINGDKRKDFVESRDVIIPGGISKRFMVLVPIDHLDSGAEVVINRIGASRRGHIFQETFVASEGDLIAYLLEHYGISLAAAGILMVFSLVIFIVSIAMRILYKRRIEMMYGALGILVISCWSITNSFIYPFVFGHYYIDGIANYMLCLFIPFSLIIYLDALQQGRYRRIMLGLLGVSFVNSLVWPILHFSGTMSFQDALLYIDLVLGAVVLVATAILIKEVVDGKIIEYKYTAIGLAGFLACALVEIMILNLWPVMNDELPMLFGLAFMLTLAVIQQIRDLKKISDERQNAIDLSEAKTRFLASMSHEIRTPINAVLGMNEMILRENRDPVIDGYAKVAKSSGRMLLMMVNDVLDFSKIEAGKMEIANAEYSFSALLRDIRPMLKERADEKSLELNLVIEGEVPERQISDEFRIRQMIINLVNNAIKYTDKGSVTLTVGGEYIEDGMFLLRLCVRDTGRGIREEDRKHLFEAFSRADIRKNRNIEGTGLGLAIVKNILDCMGGTVDVESKYGSGSAFTIELPVETVGEETVNSDSLERPANTVSADEGGDFSAKDAAVLAVDDTSINLTLLTLLLKRVDVVPDLCESGLQAIQMCKEKKYDLILLDHMMPEIDGIETLKLIRESGDSLNKDTTAVVLTANAMAGSRALYIEAGFADYLTKPIDARLLEETLKKYLPAEKIVAF